MTQVTEPVGGVWAMRDGDEQPSNFASTQSGIQEALDYCSTGGEVYIAPGTYTGITNLTMYANTTLRGAGMNKTILQRSAAATGTCLRERTLAEGNASGGSGVWIKDIRIDGNGSAGDGIDLGNQVVGVQFNFNAGMSHVHVRGFSSGVGITVRTNAISLYYIWSNVNSTGIKTQGGSSFFFGCYAEGNTTLNYDIASSNDQFYGCHSEVGGNTHFSVTGSNNMFFGVSISLNVNATNIFKIAIGGARNSLYNVTLTTNGFTFTNLIYYEANSYGTGSTNTIVPMFVDNGAFASYIYDGSTNTVLHIDGSVIGAAGASASLQVGQGTTDAFFSTMSVRSGNSGGAEAAYKLNQNGTDCMKLFYNGTATFFDAVNGLRFRDAIGGTERARISSSGVTIGSGGAPITKVLTNTASLNFDLTAVTVQDLTITVTGAAVGDCVLIGVPNGSVSTTVQYSAWVSAADTVTVRAQTSTAGENPSSGTFRATVIQH